MAIQINERKKRKVLAVCYGGGHANIIRTIYAYAKENAKDLEIIILALTTATRLFEEQEIPYLSITEIGKRLPFFDEIVDIGKRHVSLFSGSNTEVSNEDTVTYHGIGMWDLIKERGYNEAERLFAEKGRKAFLPINTATEIIRAIEPDIVLITNSPRMELAMGIAADGLGIPVVRINDLPYDTEKIAHDCYLCVMNQRAFENAKEHSGLPEDKIKITGQPVFEEEYLITKDQKKEWREKLLSQKYKEIVCFFTWNGHDESETLHALVRIAKKRSESLFVIKLHPNQAIDLFNEYKGENIIITKENAKSFLVSCDVAITSFSTTGLEAVLLDKPLIVVNFENINYPIDYVGMDIAIRADCEEQLEKAIDELLDRSSNMFHQIKKERQYYRNHENAAKNICDLLSSIPIDNCV